MPLTIIPQSTNLAGVTMNDDADRIQVEARGVCLDVHFYTDPVRVQVYPRNGTCKVTPTGPLAEVIQNASAYAAGPADAAKETAASFQAARRDAEILGPEAAALLLNPGAEIHDTLRGVLEDLFRDAYLRGWRDRDQRGA